MKILHNIQSVDKTYGGPLFSMKLVAETQSSLGHDVAIISSENKIEISPMNIDSKIKNIKISAFSKFRYMFRWEKLLLKNFGLPDVIHTYGLWNFHNFIASKIAKNIIYLISLPPVECYMKLR